MHARFAPIVEMQVMNESAIAGLVLAGAIAIVAAMLRFWETRRSDWIPDSRPGQLSQRLRRFGIGLLWLESLLIAVGSLLPTQARNDRILFVSVWGISGLLAVFLVSIAFADSLLRLFVARAIVAQHAKRRKRNFLSEDDKPDDDDGPHLDDSNDPN